jgi:hypothetical protein
MFGCLVLIGLLVSAGLGGRPGALVYLILVSLYFGLRNFSERREGGSENFGGYESREDWLRAKKMEGRIVWGAAVVLGGTFVAYLFTR